MIRHSSEGKKKILHLTIFSEILRNLPFENKSLRASNSVDPVSVLEGRSNNSGLRFVFFYSLPPSKHTNTRALDSKGTEVDVDLGDRPAEQRAPMALRACASFPGAIPEEPLL